jgi:hypothetical protein
MNILSHHLGESESMTYGSVSVAMTSEKKGMIWEGFEPSTMACKVGTDQIRSDQIRSDQIRSGWGKTGHGRVG